MRNVEDDIWGGFRPNLKNKLSSNKIINNIKNQIKNEK